MTGYGVYDLGRHTDVVQEIPMDQGVSQYYPYLNIDHWM